MPLTVTLPNISSPATTKDQIISILSNQWPLSAKSIHTTIRKEFGSETSYQAVHKALKDLRQGRVIATEGKDYKLNSEWLQNIKKFSDSVIENYENGSTNDFSNFKPQHLIKDPALAEKFRQEGMKFFKEG